MGTKLQELLDGYSGNADMVFPDGVIDAIVAAMTDDDAGYTSQIEDLTGQLTGSNNNLAAMTEKFNQLRAAAPALIDPAAADTFDDDDAPDDDDADMDDLFSDSPEDDEKK